jgi:hypothetical protein
MDAVVSMRTACAFFRLMPIMFGPLMVKLCETLPEDVAADVCLLTITRICITSGSYINFIRRMRNLRWVFCWSTLDLTPVILETLASFVHLTHLNMHRTSLCDEGIKTVLSSNLANLRVLNVSGTKVTDLSPLARLVDLEELDASNTEVSDVATLSGLTKLRKLRLRNAWRVSNLAPIRELVGLEVLDLQGVLGDVDVFAGLTRLVKLRIWVSGRSSDLSGLSGMTAMRSLQLWGPFSDISALSTMTRMVYLDMRLAPNVRNITPLAHMPHLQVLRVGSNEVRFINQSIPPHMKKVDIVWPSGQRHRWTAIRWTAA